MYFPRRKELFTTGPFVSVEIQTTVSAVSVIWLWLFSIYCIKIALTHLDFPSYIFSLGQLK